MIRPEPTSLASDAWQLGRYTLSRVKALPGRLALRRKLARSRLAPGDVPRVFYGQSPGVARLNMPIGGMVKLIPLQRAFPPSHGEFNILYMVSSALPDHAWEILSAAKSVGARFVWNQNGVAYPGWAGDRYPWLNLLASKLRAEADYIFDQSRFSRLSAERYLGVSHAPSEVLFNPVDLAMFSPSPEPPPLDRWELLTAGTSHALYRTASATETLRVLLERGHYVHLTIAGECRWRDSAGDVARLINGIEDSVTLLPPFSQAEAPFIYRNHHLLLHTKYNDPCPTVPIEAMACGLPVVASASGGMPELVEGDAGVLVPVDLGWTKDTAADPSTLADAVERVMADLSAMRVAARQRAVETFDAGVWLERHAAVFQRVLSTG